MLKVTVPEGSVERTALDWASHKIDSPIVFEAFNVTEEALAPNIVTLEVLSTISSEAIISKNIVFPSFAFSVYVG